MADDSQTTAPVTEEERRDFLRRAFAQVDMMACEGICFDGMEDPAELLSDITTRIGCENAEDPWKPAIKAIIE